MPDRRAHQLIEYVFGPQFHQPDLSRLIDEISIISERRSDLEDMVFHIYDRIDKLYVEIFRKTFTEQSVKKVREVAHVIHLLAEGYTVFVSLGFPDNRRLIARRLAIELVDRMEN